MSDCKLIPTDNSQCQAYPNMTKASAFSLGKRTPIRCNNKPTFIAQEVLAGDDGLMGEMSICANCADLMGSYKSFRDRVVLFSLKECLNV